MSSLKGAVNGIASGTEAEFLSSDANESRSTEARLTTASNTVPHYNQTRPHVLGSIIVKIDTESPDIHHRKCFLTTCTSISYELRWLRYSTPRDDVGSSLEADLPPEAERRLLKARTQALEEELREAHDEIGEKVRLGKRRPSSQPHPRPSAPEAFFQKRMLFKRRNTVTSCRVHMVITWRVPVTWWRE